LKLRHDKLLSNFALFGFNCNLRPSTKVEAEVDSTKHALKAEMTAADAAAQAAAAEVG